MTIIFDEDEQVWKGDDIAEPAAPRRAQEDEEGDRSRAGSSAPQQ